MDSRDITVRMAFFIPSACGVPAEHSLNEPFSVRSATPRHDARMNREINPQVYARAGGVLYLLIIALGGFEELFIRNRIMVGGDAAATFANLRKMEMLWRAGIAM